MTKKVILLPIIIIMLIANIYQLNILNETSQMIKEINYKIKKNNKEKEYLLLYKELQKEIIETNTEEDQTITEENIEDKIGLLKREKKINEEGLTLSEKDLENIKNKNNEVEKKIVELENLKKEETTLAQTKKFPTYNQFPKYPTGCESVSLYLLLKYYNVDVSVEDIVNSLKKGALPYQNNNQKFGGNPELEFIGDPRNNYSYGVYNKPIAEVGEKYKSGIISKTNFEFQEVLELVKNNHPVLVWTTINLSKPFISTTWTYLETNEKIEWISGEHAVVIFDVIDDKVVVSDPYTGTIRHFDKDLFQKRYNYLGKRAIYYG